MAFVRGASVAWNVDILSADWDPLTDSRYVHCGRIGIRTVICSGMSVGLADQMINAQAAGTTLPSHNAYPGRRCHQTSSCHTLQNTQSTVLTDFQLNTNNGNYYNFSFCLSQVKQCPRKSQSEPLIVARVDIVDNDCQPNRQRENTVTCSIAVLYLFFVCFYLMGMIYWVVGHDLKMCS